MPTTDSRWQLEQLYSIEETERMITTLQEQLDGFGTGQTSVSSELSTLERIRCHVEELSDFVYCLYAEDVSRQEVNRLLEQTETLQASLRTSETVFEERLSKLSEAEWTILQSETSSYYLTERRAIMERRLPAEQEKLIQALAVDGFSAWEQLYEQRLTGLRVPLAETNVTIGHALHQAFYGATRSERQTAAAAVVETCAAERDDFAMILNRIAGFRLQVYAKRGWNDPLTELCEQNRMKQSTIEAMLAAIDQNRPLFRSYYERKLYLAHVADPEWHDLEANIFTSHDHISYGKAQSIILHQFNRLHPRLAAFTKDVFDKGWIDAENRSHKAEGGFCASFPVAKESRIFMTYRDAYQDMVTLAHELGHAYHNSLLHELPFLDQIKGTSIAETASTFMENLVLDAVIEESAREEKLAMLEIKIQEGLKYVGTIPTMFRFEQRFYAERQRGAVSSERIAELMREEDTRLYGNLLAEPAPYTWIYVGHFYDTGKPFYNIPYTVGYLLSNQLYASIKQSKVAFTSQFEPLLRASGQATIEELIEQYMNGKPDSVDFWHQALEPLLSTIEMYLQETSRLVD
ncbi:M3 family oligoendopeptidase [Exiguobacterium artemiae]|uniref:M3 family oligoendopeptidase n=1 Tax=Exiguobacterium artemiae TaxID=340145 RepID=UPI0029650AFE|nr:M3 family oligoendopeptidase [Exiguobacterium sibiricum]MDW2885905.1 M3 family oligoendopeptidase [Exiguobacterium sibiricum]